MTLGQRLARCTTLLGSLCLIGAAHAQVVRDGTLGQNVPLGGDADNFIIEEIHGELSGANLFHSFLQFDLSSIQTATFTGTSPINNVISRVTGGPSTIAGLIRSDILGANIFLINPDGLTFTDTAALDVSGSFHLSTADFLQFEDGERFFAAPGVGSVLSPVDVASFGFLGPGAPISVQESILQVPLGETISVIGGDVDITGGPFGFFNAPGGQIHIASSLSAGEIALDPFNTDTSAITQLGSITLSDFAFLNVGVPGFDAGSIHLVGENLDVRGGSVLVADEGFRLFGFAVGGESGGLIDIDVRDLAHISGGSLIDASATFGGRIEVDAGNFILDGTGTTLSIASLLDSPSAGIEIVANGAVNSLLCPANICITDSATIRNSHIDTGQGASISLRGGDILIDGNSPIRTTSLGAGTGGDIVIDGNSVIIEFVDITADAQGLDGDTGSITISGNTIELRDFAFLETLVAGNGSAGGISLSGGDVLITDDSLIGTQTFSPFSVGSPGSITITADSLTLDQGSSIASANASAGTAGNIMIEVGSFNIDSGGAIQASTSDPGFFALFGGPIGQGSNIDITAGTASIQNGGAVQTLTTGVGDAGDITFDAAQSISLAGVPGASPFDTLISSGTLGALGNAGDIVLNVPLGNLAINDAVVFTQSLGGSFGDAGSISISAADIAVTNGIFSTETDGIGNAGNLTIDGGRDTLAGSALFTNSVVGTSTRGSGAAGDMTLLVSDLTLSGGRMQAKTAADGDAGDILIITDGLTIRDGAFLSNASDFSLDDAGNIISSTGGGGDLVIEASESVTITGVGQDSRSTISNLNFDGTDDRTLTIRTPVLTIENGGVIEGSTFGSGNAAVVDIDVQRLVVQSGGFIATDTSAEIDLGGGLVVPASTGAGGRIDITATESVLVAGSDSNLHDGTKVSTSTLGEGAAGGISIDSPSIEVRDGAVISAFTTSAARGGTITLNTDVLTITGNGFVVTDSSFVPGAEPELVTGRAGDIVVDAGSVSLTGTNDGFTGLRSASSTSGDGGSVRVTADDLIMSSNAQVTARADGSGNAGDVTIEVGNIAIDSGSSIETRAAIGDGGNITIGTGDLMYIADGAITTSVESGVGSGGNIRVEPRTTVLDSSEIRADAFGGDGGNIDLNSRYLIATPDSVISASSELGNAGVINVAAPDIAIVGSLTSLPADFLAAAALFRPRCEVRLTDEGSSLVVVNRAGIPASPEGLLMAYDALEPLDSLPRASGEPRQELIAALTMSSEGSRALNSGQFDDAAASFEQAVHMYDAAGDPGARDRALRSLSRAQQSRGDYEGSVVVLNQLLSAAEDSADEAGVAQTLASLGNAYIALEEPERAREHFSRGIAVAMAAERPDIAAQNLNNLANLEVTQGQYDDALGRYKESARLALEADDRLKAAKALANGARVLLRAGQPDAVRKLLEDAGTELRSVEATHDKVYALIHISRTYQRLAEVETGQRADFRDAHLALAVASTLAETLQDDRALAYARGNMAELYRVDGRFEEALVLTREALAAAEVAGAYESLYRWHRQTGRILWAAGNTRDALDAYRRAVDILQITRQETAYSYLREENSFRDSVEPVYQDLVNGLLRVAEESGDPESRSELLLEARDTIEMLKAAELRDYFRDDCIADLEARSVSVESVSSDAAIIYPVLFPDRLELLVSTTNELKRYTVPVGEAQLNEVIGQFRFALQQPASEAFIEPAQQLYQWLVAPYESDLQDANVSTLVFVPGGELRSIPIAALHDGRDFAIRKYAIAVTPILTLTDPQPLDRQDPRLLLAGISESVAGSQPLPYVPGELNAIQDMFGGRILLDDGFTTASFIEGMEDRELDIVHIASHGVFTGDPDTSFLLTHDGRISMNELSDYIGRTKFRETPLELLVLSACETAIGDDRAALGLAGVAISAGARSALGSLWAISDPATASLIQNFYTELQNPSLSRAEALRRAQLSLLDSEKGQFQHPYYWSAFLLISNWL